MQEITEQQAREALQAFLSDKWSLRVPPQPTDPDMVLDAVITEWVRLREENARLRQYNQNLIDQHGTFPYMGWKSELKGL